MVEIGMDLLWEAWGGVMMVWFCGGGKGVRGSGRRVETRDGRGFIMRKDAEYCMYIPCNIHTYTHSYGEDGDTLSQIPSAFDAHDGTDVHLATVQKVIEEAQDADAEEHDEGPVEGGAVDGRFVGPKGPEEGKGDVKEPDDVDGDAEAAEGPARGRQELRVVDAAVEDAADGDAVREHEGHNLQRDDGVERHVGPDVDECQQGADHARQQHRVGRDLPRRVHGRDPARKGQAVVARKRKCLTRRRRVE